MAKKSLKNPNFLKDLLPHQNNLPKAGSFLQKVRHMGKKKVEENIFPQSWHEDWRFTNMKPLTRYAFEPAVQPDEAALNLNMEEYLHAEANGQHIVFVNGYYSNELSDVSQLPEGVTAGSLAWYEEHREGFLKEHFGKYIGNEGDIFSQFSTAFSGQGVVIHLKKEVEVEKPIQVIQLFTDKQHDFFTTSRCLVVAENNSDAVIVESNYGLADNRYFTIPVSEFKLYEGARIKHIKIQQDSRKAIHIARPSAHVATHADYQSYTFTFGAALFRNDPHIIQTGEEVSFTLDGLVLLKGDQIADTHSTMDHKFAFAESHQLHKVVVDGSSHSIFNGKIFVRPHAQKIDSFQENRNLMISRDSTIDTKPQLEIFADDVVCSHGATVGQLEEDEMFYLQSRGLNRQQAQQLLIQAFALDIIDNITIASVKEHLIQKLEDYTNTSQKIEIPA